MKIHLYKLTGEEILLDKTDYLTELGVIDGYFREQTSIINPSISITDIDYELVQSERSEFVVDDDRVRLIIDQTINVLECNYIYIPVFNRYYFVTGKDVVRTNLIRLNCHVDVLMSFKDKIKGVGGIVDRQEFDYDLTIDDNRLVRGDTLVTYSMQEQYLYDSRNYPDKINFADNDKYYFVTIAGYDYNEDLGNGFSTTFNRTYVMPEKLYNLLSKDLMIGLVNEEGESVNAGEIFSELSQYIVNIWVGYCNFGFENSFYKKGVGGEFSDYTIMIGRVLWTKLSNFNDDEDYVLVLKENIIEELCFYCSFDIVTSDFTDIPPNRKCIAKLPFIGNFEIDLSEYCTRIGTKKLYVIYRPNIFTGDCTCYISTLPPETIDGKTVLYRGGITETFTGSMGLNVPIGMTNNAQLNAARLSARYNLISGAISSVAGIAAGSIVQSPSSVISSTTGLLQKHLDYDRVNKTLLPSYHSSPVSKDDYTESLTNGSVTLYFYKNNIIVPDNYNHLYGRPSMKYKTVGELTGFTQYANVRLADLGDATSTEKSEIENLLIGGFLA